MFQSLALLLVGGYAGWLVSRFLASRAAARRTAPPAPVVAAAPPPAVEQAPNDAPPAAAAVSPEMDEVYAIAAGLEGFYRQSAYPRDLLKNEQFRRGADLIARAEPSSEVLLDYMVGANVMTACMAMEALSHRSDDTPFKETILSNFTQVHLWTAYFALRVLSTRCEEPVVGAVLARVDDDWVNALPINILREFITLRRLRGETPSFGAELNSITSEQAANTEAVLERLRDDVPASLREELRSARESRVDTAFIGAIGRVLHVAAADKEIASTARIDEFVGQIERAISASPPRPIALVGEHGVGKSTIVRLLAHRLAKNGWTIFEAGATELVAGQSFLGQLEGRLQSLIQTISGKKVVWVVPSFQELLWAGTHRNSPSGVLDMILPHLESGAVRIIGELTPAAHERLVQAKPQLRSLMLVARMQPARSDETLALARQWGQLRAHEGHTLLSDDVLEEALQLAGQYLNDRAAPGNLLHFLQLTWQRLTSARGAPPETITLDDLLLTLSQLSGLPLSILDERQGLDLDGLRAFFNQRVIGQTEAVECLVERVAMIKAGVNDPSRPIGVFLFVGPTGTGKTEIAKTLARYLFGSADRMIRVDMSELQTSESLERIVGGGRDDASGGTVALVNEIRRQPFAVVLLDEFEKAHPNIWDLFLQVFDDGRLTDRHGNVAHFRHAVIIMTSNLGATIPYGATIGFASSAQVGFASAVVERAVSQAFRREFINRIDRVVVFRPLGRAEMREILRKELDAVLQRRGLRNRNWAVEWDATAIDFLLDRGFTPDLGARPLKRAIDRYLLAPLAETIVRHEVPAGDQFLFVRSDGERLDVLFIDPDAPEAVDDITPAEPQVAEERPGVDVRQLVLDARGTPAEVDALDDRYGEILATVESPDWERRKADALAQMRTAGFWESPTRYAVLGLAEYMDRIEAGLETAGSLIRRLDARHRARSHYPRELVQRLAQQLHLLDAACRTLAEGLPRDAYLLVRGSRDSGTDVARADAFAARVGRMYLDWARKRRMKLDVLDETAGSADVPYSALFAVSGFGAYTILRPESGLHVLESPNDSKLFNRVKARVVVAPQGDAPAAGARETRLNARAAIDAAAEETPAIVRRYREEPSPLVRDAVRRWRTGRIDRVFAGDFDVVS